MKPARCVYCGAVAETPTLLNCRIDDVEDDASVLSIPLCLTCSQSWCLPAAAPADVPERKAA